LGVVVMTSGGVVASVNTSRYSHAQPEPNTDAAAAWNSVRKAATLPHCLTMAACSTGPASMLPPTAPSWPDSAGGAMNFQKASWLT
jgi:hypothetical protein